MDRPGDGAGAGRVSTAGSWCRRRSLTCGRPDGEGFAAFCGRDCWIAAGRPELRLSRALLEDAAERAIALALGRVVAVPVGDVREERPAAARRRTIAAPPARPARSDSDRGLTLMARSNQHDLLGQEITIKPGVTIPLGSATLEHVLAAADAAAHDASAGAVRARWLRLIAKRVPMGRRVGQVFDEGTVQQLHRRAETDLAAVLSGLSKRLTTTRERHQPGAK